MMMVVWIIVTRIIFEYAWKVELIGFADGMGMWEKEELRITPSFGSKQLEDGGQPLHGRRQTGKEWDKRNNIDYMFLWSSYLKLLFNGCRDDLIHKI